jgi:hypothetical protein
LCFRGRAWPPDAPFEIFVGEASAVKWLGRFCSAYVIFASEIFVSGQRPQPSHRATSFNAEDAKFAEQHGGGGRSGLRPGTRMPAAKIARATRNAKNARAFFPRMLRLTATLHSALRLIGSAVGSGGRLIADFFDEVFFFSRGDYLQCVRDFRTERPCASGVGRGRRTRRLKSSSAKHPRGKLGRSLPCVCDFRCVGPCVRSET